jgi:hypothetical protein
VPGNVSLDSMLTEIRKLRAVRAVGLPAALFADVGPRWSRLGVPGRRWSLRRTCGITRSR